MIAGYETTSGRFNIDIVENAQNYVDLCPFSGFDRMYTVPAITLILIRHD